MSIFATKFHQFLVHVKKCLSRIFTVHVIAGDARPGPKCSPNNAGLASNTPVSNELSNSDEMSVQWCLAPRLKAGGKPSTWLPPGGLVERFENQFEICHAKTHAQNNTNEIDAPATFSYTTVNPN